MDEYKDSIPPSMYRPFPKTDKKMTFMNNSDRTYHGVATMTSDNIKNIVNHDYEKEFLERKTKKEENQIMRLLLKGENMRTMDTKASIMRNQAIKDKLDKVNQNENSFRLKQFDDVQPSAYISNTTKDIKKRYKESGSKSNKSKIETDSVLKIAELASQASKGHSSKSKTVNKKVYVGDEVEKLKNEGAQVHSFDMKKNLMERAKHQYPNLGAYAIASRFNLGKNPYKSLNKSVDGRLKTRKNKNSFYKNQKK